MKDSNRYSFLENDIYKSERYLSKERMVYFKSKIFGWIGFKKTMIPILVFPKRNRFTKDSFVVEFP